MSLWIIYTRTGMLLSRRSYASWRQIQDEIDGYTTSLGPWDEETVVDYLVEEHPDLTPPASEQVRAFLSGDATVAALRAGTDPKR